ncbi:hypothetical protein [Nonomuraea sp. NPDC049480]|uniref:hypothetical protein n=1 Tax=Nonomuraea sp. NPDC049480 TaxID=3364353 RepID=UPI00379D2271
MNDTIRTLLVLAACGVGGGMLYLAMELTFDAICAALRWSRKPFKVVGHDFGTGMVAVRWRDDPDRTHWVTPAHLAQQKGMHR